MSIKNAYLNEVYQGLAKRNAEQKEFLQAVEEVLESLEPVVEAHPEYEKASLIERLVEPERIIMFRVPWVDDAGNDGVNEAIRIIESLTKEVEAGEVYLGKVTKITAFGAFIEILPNKEGLCHISKLDNKRVEKVEDVVSVGDEILVKVTDIDSQGRINLSRKDALPQDEPTE